ncbi:hypothetical protein HY251_07065 [bacterium]|nr:hypothetical protein [bacterium]
MPTYVLQRCSEHKLREALAALKTAREKGEPAPLYPWLETWRAEGCAQGEATADDFRALFTVCIVGNSVDLLDRTPATLAGAQADKDLRSALLGLELGAGLEAWMRGENEEVLAHEIVLGLLRAEEVTRLAPRTSELVPAALFPEEDELETYGGAWERLRRTFETAARRGDALALVRKE